MTYIDRLIDAIRQTHHCEAVHSSTVQIKELFDGRPVWDGFVEVFQISHPKASRCFAWGFPSKANTEQLECVAVLGIDPIREPADAVRAAISAHAKGLVNA